MTNSTEEKKIADTINIGILTALSNSHHCLIGKVTAVGETTLSIKPMIARVVNGETKQLPELIEVPPVFLHGGTSYIAMPISTGDYALVIITDRCYDTWYEGQEGLPPAEMRMNDLSDGFAIVGVKNRAGELTIPADFIEIMGDIEHTGDLIQTGNTTQTGNVNLAGDNTTLGNVDATTYSVSAVPGIDHVEVINAKTFTWTKGILTNVV